MQMTLRFRVLFIRLLWMRGPQTSARNWGWDWSSAPLRTAAANLREAQGLSSAQGWAPSKLFQTGIRVTSWYSQGTSLCFLQARCKAIWLDPALNTLPNSFQVFHSLCTVGPAWADEAAWGALQKSLRIIKVNDKEDFHRATGSAHTKRQGTALQRAEYKHVFVHTQTLWSKGCIQKPCVCCPKALFWLFCEGWEELGAFSGSKGTDGMDRQILVLPCQCSFQSQWHWKLPTAS